MVTGVDISEEAIAMPGGPPRRPVSP